MIKKLLVISLFLLIPSIGNSQTLINGTQIRSGTITNLQISSSANIDFTKLNFAGFTPSSIGAENPLIFVTPLIRTTNTVTLTTVPASKGGTGLVTPTAGRILFGNNSTALNTSANLFWDNSTGRLGINTSSPGYSLDITGTGRITGKLIVGSLQILNGATNNYILASDASGNGTWTDPSTLSSVGSWTKVSTVISPTVTTDEVSIPKLLSVGTFDGAGNVTTVGLFQKTLTSSPASPSDFSVMKNGLTLNYAGDASAVMTGYRQGITISSSWTTAGTFQGYSSIITNQAGAGTLDNIRAYNAFVTNDGAGAVTNIFGFRSSVGVGTGAGNVTNAYAFYARSPSAGGTGDIANAVGLYIEDQSLAGDVDVTGGYQLYSTGGFPVFFLGTAAAKQILQIKQPGSPSVNSFELLNSSDTVISKLTSAGLGSFTGLSTINGNFAVTAAGDITKINNVTTTWPGSNTAGFLKNSGSGTLTWTALAGSDIASGTLATVRGGLGMDASGSTGFPKFTAGSVAIAALVSGDIPNLATSILTSGTLGIARGGTGLGTIASGKGIYASALDTFAALTYGPTLTITSGTVDVTATTTNDGGTVIKQASFPGTVQTGNINVSGTIKGGAVSVGVTNKTADYTALVSDQVILVDASGGNVNITLPSVASSGSGKVFIVKKTDSSGNSVTISRSSSDLIDGNTTIVLTIQYQTLEIISPNSGGVWAVI